MAAPSGPKPSPTHAHRRQWSAQAPAPVSSGLGCFPWPTLALLITLVSGLFVTLDSSNDGSGSQRTYNEEIGQARQQLFKGQLVYTDARSLGLVAGAEPRSFRVDVRGSWRRTGPGEAQAPVSTGTQIGVKLHCSGAGVRCTPLSSERQNVLSKNDRATWMWDVSAQRAGKVSVALTVTAYFRESNTVLIEKPPVTSRVDVAAPLNDSGWFSWAKDLWQWVTGAITSLGGLAVSVSAIVAAVVMVIRRGLPGATDEAGTAQRVRGASRRPRARSARDSHSHLGRPRRQPTTVRSLRPGRRGEARREPRE
ncbi:hypothetical protein ACFQ6S_15845 [Streptomyces sp. NPDC056479]|uniref:hypothetical protein n=1 Tax=Streptomyces sp. NPDC056479 TaxID=3345832 RepID=UPI0036AA923C